MYDYENDEDWRKYVSPPKSNWFLGQYYNASTFVCAVCPDDNKAGQWWYAKVQITFKRHEVVLIEAAPYTIATLPPGEFDLIPGTPYAWYRLHV